MKTKTRFQKKTSEDVNFDISETDDIKKWLIPIYSKLKKIFLVQTLKKVFVRKCSIS